MREIAVVVLLLYGGASASQPLVDTQGDGLADNLVSRALRASSAVRQLGSTALGKAAGGVATRQAVANARPAGSCQVLKYGCSFPNPGRPTVSRILSRMRDVRADAAVGDAFPAVEVDFGFPPEKVNMKDRLAGKKSIVVGLPGAFTPTWSSKQVPGYLAKQTELKAKGVDEVLVYCVNDGAVMDGWAKDQKVEGSMVTFLADTRSELTKALDMVLDAEGVLDVLGNARCKRFAMVVDDGKIKAISVAEGDVPDEATFAEAMLEQC